MNAAPIRGVLLLAGLVLALAGCTASGTVAPAPAAPASAAEHVERDLDQLVTATIMSNAMLAMLARHDTGVREEFRAWARAAYDRGGVTEARTEMRGRTARSFNRYARKYVSVTTDESAVAFGRAMHAFMIRLNADTQINCGTLGYADVGRRHPDLEVSFAASLRAFEQAIVSAKTTPQPTPSPALFGAEFSLIERRVSAALGLDPGLLSTDFGKLTRSEDRIKVCRASEFQLREILAYRTESAGPMLRAMYSIMPE